MSRLNWNDRRGPGDFDNTAPELPSYEFDHHRETLPGQPTWPAGFGPSSIRKAWKAGLVVVAEVGLPYPVAAQEARWSGPGKVAFEIKTLEGWKIPTRVWTRTSAKGLDSTGLLTGGE